MTRDIGAPPVPDGGSCFGPECNPNDQFLCTMTAAEDVPPYVQSPPNPPITESGVMEVILDPGNGTLSIRLGHHVSSYWYQAFLKRGYPGVSGPPVRVLLNPTQSAQWQTTVTPAEITEIRNGEWYCEMDKAGDPTRPYVRGQLLPVNEVLYQASLTGAQASTPHCTPNTAMFSMILNQATGDYQYFLQTAATPGTLDIEDATGGGSAPGADGGTDGGADPGGTIGPVTLATTGAGSLQTSSAPLSTEQMNALTQGTLQVKLTVPAQGGSTDEIAGALVPPGSTLYVAHPNRFELTPPSTTTDTTGAVRFLLSYDQTDLKYTVVDPLAGGTFSIWKAGPTPEQDVHVYDLTGSGELSTVTPPPTLTSTDVSNLISDITNEGAYVLVANAMGPDLRGQVTLPGETLYVASLRGMQAVPPQPLSVEDGTVWGFTDVCGTSLGYFGLFDNKDGEQVVLDQAVALSPGFSTPAPGFPTPKLPSKGSIQGTLPLSTFASDALDNGLLRFRVQNGDTSQIAGQLLRPGSTPYTASLDGSQVVPQQSTPPPVANAQAIVDPSGSTVRISVERPGADFVDAQVCSPAPGGVNVPTCEPLTGASDGILSASGSVAYNSGLPGHLWYVELHESSPAMDGGISAKDLKFRGQFLEPGSKIWIANLAAPSGSETTATGGFQIVEVPSLQSVGQVEVDCEGSATGVGANPAATIYFDATRKISLMPVNMDTGAFTFTCPAMLNASQLTPTEGGMLPTVQLTWDGGNISGALIGH